MRREEGQASVELVLVTGLLLLMALIVYPYVLAQHEMNRAVAAAREGATTGAALRGMGFSSGGGNEEGLVSVESIEVIDKGNYSDRDWYQIKFFVNSPEYLQDNPTCSISSVGATIRRQAEKHIYYAFNGQWVNNLPFGVNTTSYRITTSCEWV